MGKDKPGETPKIVVEGVGEFTREEYEAAVTEGEQARAEWIAEQNREFNRVAEALAADIAAALKAHDYTLAANLIVGINRVHSQ